MDLNQAMRTPAAVRRFRPDPVPDDALYRVLDSARFAPSWGNRHDAPSAAIVSIVVV